MPNYVKILLGMAVGLIIGLLATNLGFANLITNWLSPWGVIFMRLLTMIALPLVLVSLIKGIGGLKDITKLAAIGGKTVIIYTLTTVVAISIGVALVLLIKPGSIVSDSTSEKLTATYSTTVDSKISSLQDMEKTSPLQPLVDIFPANAFAPLTNNGNMLQIILIASLIGCSVILVGEEKSKYFMRFIDSADAIVLKIIDLIMSFAPIGVAALIADMIVSSAGDMTLLGALGLYGLTVLLGLGIIMYLFYPALIHLFTRVKARHFFRAIIPVQLMGFTTSSSAATLSTTMRVANDDLKLPRNITSFTLPVGVTINMDGTSCYQAIAVIFIAQVMNVDLTLAQILTIIATTTISSIGTPGIPGGSVVIVMMVLSTIGIPPEGLALIMGIDRPLDMVRTSVNVTGDVTVSAIVSRFSK